MISTRTIHHALATALAGAAIAAPAAIAQPQDFGTPAARDAEVGTSSLAGTTSDDVGQDLRSPDAKDAVRPLPGPPTWPVHPKPITAHATANQTAPGGGDDTPWGILGLGITLAAGGATAGVAGRRRRRSRVAA
jgi:hypothetical protein